MALKIASACEWWMSITVAHSIPHGMGEKYISISATVVSWVACMGVSNQSPLCAILSCLEQINYQWKKKKTNYFDSTLIFIFLCSLCDSSVASPGIVCAFKSMLVTNLQFCDKTVKRTTTFLSCYTYPCDCCSWCSCSMECIPFSVKLRAGDDPYSLLG